MNAIIVYNSVDFFRAYRNLPSQTWLVWIDTAGNEQQTKGEKAR